MRIFFRFITSLTRNLVILATGDVKSAGDVMSYFVYKKYRILCISTPLSAVFTLFMFHCRYKNNLKFID